MQEMHAPILADSPGIDRLGRCCEDDGATLFKQSNVLAVRACLAIAAKIVEDILRDEDFDFLSPPFDGDEQGIKSTEFLWRSEDVRSFRDQAHARTKVTLTAQKDNAAIFQCAPNLVQGADAIDVSATFLLVVTDCAETDVRRGGKFVL